MTGRQFRRLRKWDRKVYPAYSAGIMDGFDAFLEGRECPEPLHGGYDTKLYLRRRMRFAQGVSNATVARSRGRFDGWHLAAKEVAKADKEDWIESQVIDGLAKFEALLRAA